MKSEILTFRVSESECERINYLVDSAGVSRSDYLRSMALKQRITRINADKKVIRECRVELARQGNNLNQIARHLNTVGIYSDSVTQIDNLLNKIEKISDVLYEISMKAIGGRNDSD